MKRQVIIHACVYCKKPFEANRSTARYCSGTCKTYASQERTGRRKPVSIAGESDAQSEESRQVEKERLKIGLQKLQRQKREFENKADEIEGEIRELEKQKKLPDLSIEERQRHENRIKEVRQKFKELEYQFDRMLFQEVEIKQDLFDLELPEIWNDGLVKGADISRFAEYRVRYPFMDLRTQTNLKALGNPPRPFICYVCECEPGYQCHLATVMELAGEIAAFSDSEMLIIIDQQFLANGFERHLKQNGLQQEKVTLKFARNRADIEAVLEATQYEFVVFPDLSIFNLGYNFLTTLLKRHPRTSIFCASEKPMHDFIYHNRLNVRMQTGYDDSGWGGILVTQYSEYVLT